MATTIRDLAFSITTKTKMDGLSKVNESVTKLAVKIQALAKTATEMTKFENTVNTAFARIDTSTTKNKIDTLKEEFKSLNKIETKTIVNQLNPLAQKLNAIGKSSNSISGLSKKMNTLASGTKMGNASKNLEKVAYGLLEVNEALDILDTRPLLLAKMRTDKFTKSIKALKTESTGLKKVTSAISKTDVNIKTDKALEKMAKLKAKVDKTNKEVEKPHKYEVVPVSGIKDIPKITRGRPVRENVHMFGGMRSIMSAQSTVMSVMLMKRIQYNRKLKETETDESKIAEIMEKQNKASTKLKSIMAQENLTATKIKNNMKDLKTTIGAIAIGGMIKHSMGIAEESIASYSDRADSVTRENAYFINNMNYRIGELGETWRLQSGGVHDFQGAVEKTLKGVNDIIDKQMQKTGTMGRTQYKTLMGQLASFQINPDDLVGSRGQHALGLFEDLSTSIYGLDASKENLMNVGNMVGKAISMGYAGQLKRWGDVMTDAQIKTLKTGSELEKVNTILEVLTMNNKNFAKLLSETPVGQVKKQTILLEDMQSKLGKSLATIKVSFLKLRIAMFPFFAGILEGFGSILGVLAESVAWVLRLINKFDGLGEVIGITLATALGLWQITKILGVVGGLMTTITTIGEVLGGVIAFVGGTVSVTFGLLLLAIVGVIIAVQDLWTYFHGGKSVIGDVIDWFKELWQKATGWIGDITDKWTVFKKAFSDWGNEKTPTFTYKGVTYGDTDQTKLNNGMTAGVGGAGSSEKMIDNSVSNTTNTSSTNKPNVDVHIHINGGDHEEVKRVVRTEVKNVIQDASVNI